MVFNIIGTVDEILKIVMELSFLPIKIEISLIGQKNKNLIETYIRQKKLTNIQILSDEFSIIMKKTNCLVLAINDRNKTLKIIKDWIRFHDIGVLVLMSVFEFGFSDKVYQWLIGRGKRIEVIVIPRLPYSKIKDRYFLIGGQSYFGLAMFLRKELAKINVPVFLISRKEAEISQFAYQSFLIVKKAYQIELEKNCKKLGVDIEVIKKALNQISGFRYLKEREDKYWLNKSLSQLNNYQVESEQKLFNLSRKIVKNDKDWAVEELKRLLSQHPIQVVAIWGIDEIETVLKISRLSIKRIHIYDDSNNQKLVSSKVFYFKDLYQTVDGADILLILDLNDDYTTVSLSALEKRISQKIIIDRFNIFELYEINLLNWIYISKGRANVYNY
ncbi:hypothetical protein BHF71_08155 [Vulcanibacillus modesticaldus]|uniref:Uncharacterized protein n=1 Tax=Vulcanibacillus modesticaldus TaxID=337097 RepID=A0A1D2YVA0_9BACI|nr:hypothetical protein [Vulcanibacillus modesticaldus]OEF99649.1 hypothetical protein BHF71_08155 [Vulcanibacillus modesticaldus]